MTSPRLLIPEISENQAGKYLTHNEAVRVIDALVQLTIQDYVDEPPVGAEDGQCWIVGPSPTGAWSGQAQRVAQRYNDAWYFYTPEQGWWAHNAAAQAMYEFNGVDWELLSVSSAGDCRVDGLDELGYLEIKVVGGDQIRVNKLTDPGGVKSLEIEASINVSAGTRASVTKTVDQQGVTQYQISADQQGTRSFVASLPGATRLFTGKLRFYPRESIVITNLFIASGVQTTGALSIDVLKNGVTVFPTEKPTVSGGGSTSGNVSCEISLTSSDYLTVSVLSTGGASDVVIRFDY